MKKICIVSTTGSVINAFMLKHIEYLSKEYEVTIILGDSSKINCSSNVKRIAIERKINILKDIRSLFNLIKFFRNKKFDIVLSIMPKSGLLSMIASYLSNINMRIHFFTGQVWATKQGLLKEILKSMDKLLVKSSSHLLIDSVSQKDFLFNEGIIKKNNAFVLNKGSISGVNLDKFSISNNTKEKLRIEYNFSGDDIVFMFLGRMNRDKGLLELSTLFLKLFKKYNNIKLVLIGPIEDEKLKDEMNDLFNHNCVTGKFQFISNPEYMLNLADVLVLPSHREGFGTIVIESAAMKIPTIGSNIYGLNDAIIDKETGILHEVNNINDMLIKYSELIENKTMIHSLGDNAYKRVIKYFDDKDISIALLNFIKEEINERK